MDQPLCSVYFFVIFINIFVCFQLGDTSGEEYHFDKCKKKNNSSFSVHIEAYWRVQEDITVGRALALHMANLILIPFTPYGQE